jgi:hypothetical protein
MFRSAVASEAARLDAALGRGPRIAAAVILACHKIQGDIPVRPHVGAYGKMVDALAGPDYMLVWPPTDAPLDPTMESTARGEVYRHAVDFVVRPGLTSPAGQVLVRPRVVAR